MPPGLASSLGTLLSSSSVSPAAIQMESVTTAEQQPQRTDQRLPQPCSQRRAACHQGLAAVSGSGSLRSPAQEHRHRSECQMLQSLVQLQAGTTHEWCVSTAEPQI